MQFQRFMTASEFVRELDSLRAFGGQNVGTGLLESLEAARLLVPRCRVRYPAPIARRFWLLTHEHMPRQLIHSVEPDGTRWDAAVDFDKAMHRWAKSIVYGPSAHPLDDP